MIENAKPALPSSRREQSPEAWVTEQLAFTTEDGAGVYKFRVEARNRDGERFRPLVAVLRQKSDTPDAMFNKLDLQAARCQSPQVQITAWMRAATKQPVGMFLWPVEYVSDDQEDEGDDEGGDSLGKTVPAMYRQLAKHNETLMAAMMRNAQSTMMHLAGQNERFEKERETLMRERTDTFEAYRAIIDDEETRKAKAERWGKVAETFKTLAEATAFRITQGKVAPDAQSSILLRSLGILRESITPAQAEGLAKLLTANQLTLLATLVTNPEEYAAKAVKTQESSPPPPPAPDPPDPPAPPPEEKPSTNQAASSRKKRSAKSVKKKLAKRTTVHKTR